ncbi:hypothetical protein HF086_017983 [Spodoptera exigua]|uniref:Uncharacterized protein n=1 Tax=Spodoptera exigua TaxID=7107 RepID=A0A922S8Q7_SPOEX|nr:hypothetical protein HF086_017983 [Spodoptera exigua]
MRLSIILLFNIQFNIAIRYEPETTLSPRQRLRRLPQQQNILVYTKMATDEEKCKLNKLLQGLEVSEVKLTERCSDLVKTFQQRFGAEVEAESSQESEKIYDDLTDNPYKVDPQLLEENEKKLRELLNESKRSKKANSESVLMTSADDKRPWRTNSSKEKLFRVDSELKRHMKKSSQMIVPLPEHEMQHLVKECREEGSVAPAVGANRLRETVDAAKKNLPNFQYKKIYNSTATSIMPQAHTVQTQPAQPKVTN